MTGRTGGWAYFAATRYMLGIRPLMDGLEIDPCIPGDWDDFPRTGYFAVRPLISQWKTRDHVEKRREGNLAQTRKK